MITTTDATFERDVLESPSAVLVYFWATWCGPCTMLSPILDAISTERDDLTVVKMDADENPGTVLSNQITSVPTMKLVRDGEVVRTILGAKPRPAIDALLADVL